MTATNAGGSRDGDADGSLAEAYAAAIDEASADGHQPSADVDQAQTDRKHAGVPPDPLSQLAYETSLTERLRASVGREGSAAARVAGALTRARAAIDRDQTARLRDLSAAARDHAADARDRAMTQNERTVKAQPATLETLHQVLEHSAQIRGRAARDRARAAADRAQAATDRAHAAVDRRQARIDLQRAHLDELTGVYTRGIGELQLGHELDRARRSGEPFVLAYIDVDHLKDLNDRNGHAAGDTLLQHVAVSIKSKLRSYDPIVREGGDEFVCGLTNTELDAASRRMEEIREAIAEVHPAASISVGLATLAEGDTLPGLLARADEALYRAKAARDSAVEDRDGKRH
jgi:diguanylate cyclase (GGDEF)-like protein